MNEKKNAWFTIGILFSIILTFTVADLVKGDRFFSERENRILASRPKLTLETVLDGSYESDYETYVSDQFVGRDKWITLKNQADLWLQKKELNGVYLGRDGYLIEQHKPEDYTEELEEEKLDLLARLKTEFYLKVMLVPTADNILTEKLPGDAIVYDETRLLQKVKKLVGDYNYVDVYSALLKHKDEDIYYRTDHHWTSLGAYYGYRAWAENIHRYPLMDDPDARETVSADFQGTLESKVNLAVEPDQIQYYPDTEKLQVEITYDQKRTSHSFYEDAYLGTKNQYGYFLDDNHGLVEIHTGMRNGRKLFVIKDSYANCMIPLITQHYEYVYVVDLRYFNGRLIDFMKQYEGEDTMEVLVLYDCIHFLEDFKYY